MSTDYVRGPWKWRRLLYDELALVNDDDTPVLRGAQVWDAPTGELIAQAPNLVDACERAINLLARGLTDAADMQTSAGEAVAVLLLAVAKAKGQVDQTPAFR